ncbi:TetR/AcrR family transcriptional regulator [Bacterioplanoides sp.]|uniref:TetR/AcrR family transcriptional regulator n=1 Tax=Bacterioplanoides sp. TaxID=2066072 RepID=UPI003B5C7F85
MTKQKYKPGKIRERNNENILAAAEQEFVLHGFKGTSMQSIADRAGVPKANIHYYFKNKANLYRALLENIMQVWNEVLADITPDSDPADVLSRFIRSKVQLSYTHPNASKIFAMEIIQGAPHLREHLSQNMRAWVKERSAVIQSWIDQGKIRAIDPTHLIFMIWATTQHYADFETQVLEVLNKRQYEPDDIDQITDFLIDMIFTRLGLSKPEIQPFQPESDDNEAEAEVIAE